MIITRAPFRVSFCGGGSDLAAFYEKHEGCVLSTSINKYMYISLHPYFDKGKISLKYSSNELVSDYAEIKHRIFHQCLEDFNITGVEISSTADVPAGTGLGSSSTFTVALLHLLHLHLGKSISKEELARAACEVEINKLLEPIGKQDQYAAAYGGLNFYTFRKNGEVEICPIKIYKGKYEMMENNLLMFYTGNVRSASSILTEQTQNMSQDNIFQIQAQMCEHAKALKVELENNRIDSLGELMHQTWLLKKKLSSNISNPVIDELYSEAVSAGAIGGKLLGAGGGGFLLFYVRPDGQNRVRQALRALKEMKFGMDNTGSTIIYNGYSD